MKAEKIVIDNKSIKDIFKDDFIHKLKKTNRNIYPVNIVFISETEKNGSKQIQPLVFSHQTSEEVQKNIMHIESPDTELVEIISKIIAGEK